MKYHFTGTQSTGKTTLLNLMRNIVSYDFVTEIVRNLHKEMGVNINEEGDEVGQILIFNTYLSKTLFQDRYISDRSLIDVIAYTKYLSEHSSNFNPLVLKAQENLLDFTVSKQKLGYIFYIPIEFALEDDGIRSLDEDFRKEIDNNILYYLQKFEIPYIKVFGSIDERLLILNHYIL